MADKPRSSSGGVKNLRAMFEQNKDEVTNSPPDRGRSPAGSMGTGSNGTSPRPLSKVRTSFVTVERSGQFGPQWGLRRESTTDNSMAKRRGSFSIDEETDPQAVQEKKTSIAAEYLARRQSQALGETIPEFAVETPPLGVENRLGYKPAKFPQQVAPAVSKPSANPDKKTAVEDTHGKLLPGDPTSKAAVTGGAALNGSSGFGETLNGNMSGKLNIAAGPKNGEKTNGKQTSSRPSHISTAQTSSTAKSGTKTTKSPTSKGLSAHRTENDPMYPSAVHPNRLDGIRPPRNEDAKHTEKHQSPTSTSAKSKATTGRPSTSSSTNTTATKKTATSTVSVGGFVKPRPKSPTRPVKLPPSMTTHTASSLSKVASGSTNGGSRASLGPASTTTASRSPSRASLAPNTAELRRKSSSYSQRPSLGPPPVKKQPSRQSLARATTPADEGFLARMMRPTQSSASKTHEKVATPPRSRPATRPTTRDGSGQHKPHEGSKGSPAAKRTPVHVKAEQVHHEELPHVASVAEKLAKEEEEYKAEPVTPIKVERVAEATPVKTEVASSSEPISHADHLEPVETAQDAFGAEVSVEAEAKQESASVNAEPVLPVSSEEPTMKADVPASEEVTAKAPQKVEVDDEQTIKNEDGVKGLEEHVKNEVQVKEEDEIADITPAEAKASEIGTAASEVEESNGDDGTVVKEEEEEADAAVKKEEESFGLTA